MVTVWVERFAKCTEAVARLLFRLSEFLFRTNSFIQKGFSSLEKDGTLVMAFNLYNFVAAVISQLQATLFGGHTR